MSHSEETLMAYADEQLDPQGRAQVEAAMAADPLLADKVSQHRALRARLRRTFDRVLEEPVPERLLSCARTAPTLQGRSNVIPLRRKRQPARWSWAQAGTVAAALLLGLVAGQMLPRSSDTEPITRASDGTLLAGSTLAHALSSQLGGQHSGPVQIGVSFRSRSGHYCRTFALQSLLTGLACREEAGWRVRVLAEEALQAPDDREGAALPSRITQAVQDQLAIEPLDAQGEAVARARDWKPD